MAEVTYPGASNAIEDEWPLLAAVSDGILNDFDGSRFGLTTSGSSPTVTVSPGNGGVAYLRVAGFVLAFDAAKTLDLSTVGTQPTGTQKRVDLIVARYDWSKPLNSAITIEVRPGAPVPAGANFDSSVPAPVQTRGSIWEEPLHAVSRPAGGVVTTVGSMRSHAVQLRARSSNVSTPFRGPIGTVYLGADNIWKNTLFEDGSVAWLDTLAYDRSRLTELARPRLVNVAANTLANGSINATGVTLGGSKITLTKPTVCTRVLVEADLQGLGPNSTALVNTVARLSIDAVAKGPEVRIIGTGRSARLVAEHTFTLNRTFFEAEVYMRSLAGGNSVTIGDQTTLAYKVTFS